MSGTLTNSQRKKNFGDAIKVKIAINQAGIYACKEKRAENRRKSQELAEATEKNRIQRLFNLNQPLIFVYIVFENTVVIIAIAIPSTTEVIYGSPVYKRLRTNITFTLKGKRCISDEYLNLKYRVFTQNGIDFTFFDPDGNVALNFQSILPYRQLAGKSIENVFVKKTLYDPKGGIPNSIKTKSIPDPNSNEEMNEKFKSLLFKLVKDYSSNECPYRMN